MNSIENLEAEIAALEAAEQGGQLKDVENKEAQADSKATDSTNSNQEKEETVGETADWKKRYGDLRAKSQKDAERLKQLERKIAELETSKADLPSIAEAEEWASKNPKAAEIIRALAEKQIQPEREKLLEVKNEVQKDKERFKILKAHPDFEEITLEDDFHNWAESQPQFVKDKVFGDEAEGVIWAIGLYKKEIEKPTDKNKDAAKFVKTKANVKPSEDNDDLIYESDVYAMSAEQYAQNEDKIFKAQRSGKFVYDISQAAKGRR